MYHLQLLIVFLFCPSSLITRNVYKVAVVEYFPQTWRNVSNQEIFMHNVDNYIKIIDKTTSNHSLDMMVFPESTLQYGCNIKQKEDLLKLSSIISVEQNRDTMESFITIEKFGNAARKHKIYLSINLLERTINDQLFNTNIVFDRTGHIISRYRKLNLFNEPFLDRPNITWATFRTDFNVTFGVFTCFDIFFKDPTEKLLEIGVKHFIMPNFWFSELPFLTSIQVQNMWAFKNNVVLLSSGANNPKTSTTGSGIYLGLSGPQSSVFLNSEETNVLIGEIPVEFQQNIQVPGPGHLRNTKYFPFWKDNLNDTRGEPLDVVKNLYMLPKSNPRCQIQIKFSNATSKKYQKSKYFLLFGDSCALVLCHGHNIASCTQSPNENDEDEYNEIDIESIEVKILQKDNDNDIVYFPNVILRNLEFLDVNKYEWNEEQLLLRVKNTLGNDKLQVFGIYGLNVWKKWHLPR